MSRGVEDDMTNPDGSSCYYVQMRKNCHYRMGDWRRELMADEMASIDRKELEALSREARLTQDQVRAILLLACITLSSRLHHAFITPASRLHHACIAPFLSRQH